MKRIVCSVIGLSMCALYGVARTPQTDVDVHRPQTAVSATRPTTEVSVLRPATTVSVHRPVTQDVATHPATTVQINRPTTDVLVNHPATTAQAIHPQTTVEVLRPQTTVEVVHPQTPLDSEMSPAVSAAPSTAAGERGGSSTRTATSMSGYQPKPAKDFTAPAKAAPLGGGDNKLGNVTNEVEKDAANKESLMGKQTNQDMTIDPSKTNLSGFDKIIEQKMKK